ncbi:MAG: PQQ-binding-like beta-propeller repeat protein, partial [Planctomycetaceae bacterium]|nr:PQQ-binding-like beta-propeller repeat protein [Planctomycetaceae bacterium]
MRIPSSAVSLPIAEWRADGDRPGGTAVILLWTALLVGLSGSQADAWQQNAPPENADENAPTLPQRLPTDRKTNQVLSQLRESLEAGRASDALNEFRTLQTADPLTLVPADEGKIYIPLFRALFELAFQLPADVRDALVETEAARMERRLSVAVRDGNLQAISEVVLSGAGTPASIDAHWIVARLHLARGNVTAAQTWLLPLTAPGLPQNVRERANRLLADFRPQRPENPPDGAAPQDTKANANAPVSSGTPPAEGGRPDAREDQSVPRQSVVLPENLMWQSRPNISPRLRGQIDVFLQSAAGSNFPPQTSWREVIDADRIYRRSLRGLTCVDAASGQSIWEYPLLPPVEPQISSSVSSSPIVQQMRGIPSVGFTSMDSSPFVSVFCRDNSIGQIAADNEALYLIQNTPDYLGASRTTPQFMPFGARSPKRDSGQLIAIEKSSGRRIWTLAETTLEERLGPSSSSGWFGGPPLADGHFLYSVFEWDGEMRLGCISRVTGELNWSCVLAFPEQTIDRDAVRSLWGCTPVRREGLIWCPTSTGWLTCVDEATQSIVFASQLHELKQQEPTIRMGRNQPVVFTRSASLRDRWSVVEMVSSADRMVIAAHESRDLVWMEAATGVQLQRQEVAQGEILVHANSDRVILSTAEHVRAFDTYSGQLLWLLELNDVTGYPFGKGTLTGDILALPMSTGCIAAVDLKSGELIQTSRNVLPSPGWGRLAAVRDGSGDYFYLAADRLWRLSTRPTTETSGDPLEIAQGLLDSGDWQGALDVAGSTESTMVDRSQREAIMFAAQLQLAAGNPDADLAAIREMPLTAEQQLQLTVLDACLARQRGDLQTAADALVKIVQMPMEFLKAPAPTVARNWPAKQEVTTDAPQESVLTWATCCLTDLLGDPDVDTRLTDALQACSNDIVSRISHPQINDVLSERIRTTESLDQLF